ncbi:hypothetical protein V1460_28050 [Streptomyces sp. SCSIO 30461]|uniref:hypothetical protein n=1 Tax=Streptomyces sp. SCSIO 30461 TaxID=3118085 RepID=UPI0030D188C8
MTFRHVLAEWRKIALRPVTLLLFAVLAVGSVTTAFYAQDFWYDSEKNARVGVQYHESGESYRNCLEYNPKLGPAYCDRQEEGGLQNARQWLSDSEVMATEAARGQTLPGAFGWAAQAFASFPGLLVVLLLAASSMGGEYDNRTAGNLLLADPNVRRHILAKAAALWLTTAVALCFAGASVAAFAMVKGRPDYPLTAFYPSAGQDLAHGLRLVGGALLATAVWSLVAVALASWSRNRVGGTLRAGAVLVVLMLGSGITWLWEWLPGGVLAEVMDFRPGHVLWNVWWGPASDGGVPLMVRAVPALLVTALGIAWVVRRAGRGNEVT